MKAMCIDENKNFVWQDVPDPVCHGEFDEDPKKFLTGKIEKVTFSEPSKRALFTPFRLCFGKEPTFLIPHADWIRQDLDRKSVV